MTRARAGALLLAIFLLGALCGALGAVAWVRRDIRTGGVFGERIERMAARRIARRLELDPAQRDTLRRILVEARHRTEAVREETMERVSGILDDACDALVPHLRDDQRRELELLRRETRERFRVPADRRRGKGPGGPPRPGPGS